MAFTAKDVAEWMYEEVQQAGVLHQDDAVTHIVDHFGEAFIYVNENGNKAIDKEVKKLFKKMHGGRAAWERDGFFWGWS